MHVVVVFARSAPECSRVVGLCLRSSFLSSLSLFCFTVARGNALRCFSDFLFLFLSFFPRNNSGGALCGVLHGAGYFSSCVDSLRLHTSRFRPICSALYILGISGYVAWSRQAK